jgi:hypothetical protein
MVIGDTICARVSKSPLAFFVLFEFPFFATYVLCVVFMLFLFWEEEKRNEKTRDKIADGGG